MSEHSEGKIVETDVIVAPDESESVQNHVQHGLNKEYVCSIEEAILENDIQKAHDLTLNLHNADIADLLEYLDRPERTQLIEAIGEDLNGSMLTELEPRVRDHILTLLEPKIIANMVSELEISDAVYLLENTPPVKLQEILSHISGLHRVAVEQAFQYPEDSAARIMRRDFISLPGYWTVGQAIDFFMDGKDLPEKFYDIYVVDPLYKPVGILSLSNLLKAGRAPTLESLADQDFHSANVEDDQEEVAYLLEHYRVNSVPVVGRGGRIIGTILVDDAVEIIQSEADEDIKQLAGVGGEEITDTIGEVVKNRGYWLMVNLITAILAAVIIAFFSDTIEKYVVLAAMGPLVASMGGNAGSQTLTVAVRAIATRSLNETNMRKIVLKELKVGLLNGIIFAVTAALLVVSGAVFDLWPLDYKLCIIMASAMLVSMVSAAMSGILIPLLLRTFKVDPAVSAVVFVTTVTDVVGFFSVLGLAYIILQ
ncbi:MAG: magnesium transporter [Pseudomonadota bacterium]